MALTLPVNFKNDIQGKDTALIPTVWIGNAELGNNGQFHWVNDIAPIIISTNAGVFPAEYQQAMPLLLNIPSLKESIDIEKRNYKISNVNLDISNFEYEGKRFSELVTERFGSLINIECRIQWASPSATNLTITDIEDRTAEQTIGDMFYAYKGIIRRYEHDDEKVRLVLEDRSQSTMHKDLPLPGNYLGIMDTVPEKYKNKPIPMVYGNIDRSPLMFNDNYRELIADTREIVFVESDTDFFGQSSGALWMHVGTHYINVVQANQYEHNSPEGKIDITSSWATQAVDEDDKSEEQNFICRDESKDFQVSLTNPLESPDGTTADMDIPQGSVAGLIDGVGALNNLEWYSTRNRGVTSGDTYSSGEKQSDLVLFYDAGDGNLSMDFRSIWKLKEITGGTAYNFEGIEFLLLKLGFNYTPSYDFESSVVIGMKINGNDISDVLPAAGEGVHVLSGKFGVPVQTHEVAGTGHDVIGQMSEDYTAYGTIATFINIDDGDAFYNVFNFDYLLGNSGGNNPSAAFQIKTDYAIVDGGLSFEVSADLNGSNVGEIELFRETKVTKIFSKDYYARVNGRRNSTNTGAMRVLHEIINDILCEELEVPYAGGTIGSSGRGWASQSLYDDSPNENAGGWKYDFTIDKKINSKKLIEGLASASSYMPRFDYLGNFKLNKIKLQYLVDDIYDYDEMIKSEDVISFKYDRTKIEDVYNKVEFHYKHDYALDKFNGKVESINAVNFFSNYNLDYYGFEEDNVLIVDDDRGKYIRDNTTAAKFAEWLMLWHCNQHLIITLQLPLKYMFLEIGDEVKFNNILGDVNPYGISYQEGAVYNTGGADDWSGSELNGQQVYSVFMVTSTNKKLNSIELKVIQMHNLSGVLTPDLRFGCTNPNAINYKSTAEFDDGSCIVIPHSGVAGNQRFRNIVFPPNGSTGYCPYYINPDDPDQYSTNYGGEYPSNGDIAIGYGQRLIDPAEGNYNVNDITHTTQLHNGLANTNGSDNLTPAISSGAIRVYDPGHCNYSGVVEPRMTTLNSRLYLFDTETPDIAASTIPVFTAYEDDGSFLFEPDYSGASFYPSPQYPTYYYYKIDNSFKTMYDEEGHHRLSFLNVVLDNMLSVAPHSPAKIEISFEPQFFQYGGLGLSAPVPSEVNTYINVGTLSHQPYELIDLSTNSDYNYLDFYNNYIDATHGILVNGLFDFNWWDIYGENYLPEDNPYMYWTLYMRIKMFSETGQIAPSHPDYDPATLKLDWETRMKIVLGSSDYPPAVHYFNIEPDWA